MKLRKKNAGSRAGNTTKQWSKRNLITFNYSLSSQQPLFADTQVYEEVSELKDIHYGLELGIVLRGKIRRTYMDWQQEIGPGQVWFCGLWEPHSREILQGPYEHVYLIIYPQFLMDLRFEELPGMNLLAPFTVEPRLRPQVSASRRKEMIELGNHISRVIRNQDSLQTIWLRTFLIQALLLVLGDWRAPRAEHTIYTSNFHQIHPAFSLLFDSTDFITEADAAKSCNMSRSSFNRSFRELMGVSFAKFSLRYRLNGVAADLLRGDKPLKSIASNWGFAHVSHLCRCFQRSYRCSPLQYRKKFQNGGAAG